MGVGGVWVLNFGCGVKEGFILTTPHSVENCNPKVGLCPKMREV